MHHLIQVVLAGAKQLGPAMFWASAMLRHADDSQDQPWLSSQLPRILKAVGFALKQVDKQQQLASASGPLMIDTFKRSGFTTDSNSFLVLLLKQLEATVKDLPVELARRWQPIQKAINTHLWHQDHFITQTNGCCVRHAAMC